MGHAQANYRALGGSHRRDQPNRVAESDEPVEKVGSKYTKAETEASSKLMWSEAVLEMIKLDT